MGLGHLPRHSTPARGQTVRVPAPGTPTRCRRPTRPREGAPGIGPTGWEGVGPSFNPKPRCSRPGAASPAPKERTAASFLRLVLTILCMGPSTPMRAVRGSADTSRMVTAHHLKCSQSVCKHAARRCLESVMGWCGISLSGHQMIPSRQIRPMPWCRGWLSVGA